MSFEWDGQQHTVAAIEHRRRELDRASGKVNTVFYVITADGAHFRLCYEEAHDRWTIEPQRG